MKPVVALLLIGIFGGIIMADNDTYVINSIFIEIVHQADGKKYPNFLQ
ncbi:MAG: hypothetical protein GX640_10750 [Fibrobacter sp.]|nr:hypothetical protein [Fibrobacter sp.]